VRTLRRFRDLPGLPALPGTPALLAFLLLAVVTGACSSRPPDDSKSYVPTIAAALAKKDAEFRYASDSPVPQNRRAELLPLASFPIDPAYSVPASLKPSSDRASLQMPTSTGALREMRRVGTLEFTVKGQPLKLTAFVDVGERNLDHLFVPFTDLTTGTETYPGGRYLDLDRNG